MKIFIFGLLVIIISLIVLDMYTQRENIITEDGFLSVYFCSEQNCEVLWTSHLQNASSVVCALYTLNSDMIKTSLSGHEYILHKKNRSGLMHNKFCVLDKTLVITGSTNPTQNGLHKNKNHLIIIESQTLAQNYYDEYEEIAHGKISATQHEIMLDNILVQNYFCPEDACEQQVLNALDTAQHSVVFMTYSFTSDAIGSKLIELSFDGVHIEGIFDKTQTSKYSEHHKLADSDIPVYIYKGLGKLHHKVFIIDNKTVITGSYNPTRNGNEYNDENMLIIHDRSIAEQFIDEYNKLYNQSLYYQNS